MREGEAQLLLRYELAATAARRYAEAAFQVVWQDVILGPHLRMVADMLSGIDFGIVVLCPSPTVVAEREKARPKTGYGGWTPEMLDTGFRASTPRLGLWLDTSALDVTQTVDAVFARAGETRTGPAAV